MDSNADRLIGTGILVSRGIGWKAVAVVVSIVLIPIFVGLIWFIAQQLEQTQESQDNTIPPALLSIYQEIGAKYGIDWSILAALHQLDPGYSADVTAVSFVNVKYAKEIAAAAARYKIDPALLTAVIKQESNFNPRERSPAGAIGLTQQMPENCREAGLDPATTCWDPAKNIMAGARELKSYLVRYHGNIKLALAAYNAGPGNVEKYGGVPPFPETQNYVRRVPQLYEKYKAMSEKDNGKTIEQIKAKIEKLAQQLDALRAQHEKSVQAGKPTECMQVLQKKADVTIKNGEAGRYGALSCAIFSLKKDWGAVAAVETTATGLSGESIIGQKVVPVPGGFLWPAPSTHRVTSDFSPARLNPVTGKVQPHEGIDIGTGGKIGQPAVAAKAGRVIFAGVSNGYGNLVIIDHGGGITTRYGHLAHINVTVGQVVPQGYPIGIIGSTGTSTGIHLHFEIRKNGQALDPLPFLTGKASLKKTG